LAFRVKSAELFDQSVTMVILETRSAFQKLLLLNSEAEVRYVSNDDMRIKMLF